MCEAGFPIASEGDFQAVKRVAEEIGPLLEGRKSGKPMVLLLTILFFYYSLFNHCLICIGEEERER